MTEQETKDSLVVGGIYKSPYSGKVFKLLPGFVLLDDHTIKGVATQAAYEDFKEDTGLTPYYWYDNKPALRVDTEIKQLPIFN